MLNNPINKPSYFLFQDSAFKLSLWKNNNNYYYIMHMKYEQNGKFQFWLKFTYHFLFTWYLLGTYNHCKEFEGDFKWRMLFKVAFRCMFY